MILWLACAAPEDTDEPFSPIPELVRQEDLNVPGYRFSGRGLAIRKSGDRLVVLSDRALYLFGAERVVVPMAGRVLDVAGATAWVAGEGRIVGVDVASGRIIRDIPLIGTAVAVCADPLAVVLREKGLVRFDSKGNVVEELATVTRCDPMQGTHVAFGDPGRLVSASGEPLGVLPIRTAAADILDNWLWIAGDEIVHYGLAENTVLHRRTLPAPAVDLAGDAASVAVLTADDILVFSPDLRHVYPSHDPIVGLWTDGSLVRALPASGRLSTRSLGTGKPAANDTSGPGDASRALAGSIIVHEDGRAGDQSGVRYAATDGVRTIYSGDAGVWGFHGTNPLVLPDRPRGTPGKPALGPDGLLALPLADGSMQVIRDDLQRVQIAGARDADGAVIPVSDSAFFPDGKHLVLVRDGRVTIHDAVRASAPVFVPVPQARAIAVDPGGRAVYVATADGAWIAGTDGFARRISDFPASSIATGGTAVLVGGDDGVVRRWEAGQ